MKFKHKKTRNTGLLFEMLISQVTHDVLKGKDSPCIGIIKEFFSNNTELSKEYKLYKTLISASNLNNSKAEIMLESINIANNKINKKFLKNEKYNLIKRIQEHYDINDFFKFKVDNYKVYASIYNMLDYNNSDKFISPENIVNNKITLIEHITNNKVNSDSIEDEVMNEFIHSDKGTRLLIYQNLVESFNTKYSNLIPDQKVVLKEYINNMDNNKLLRENINSHISRIKSKLNTLKYNINDTVTKVKINEVISILLPMDNSTRVSEDDVLNVMQYYELINEVENL